MSKRSGEVVTAVLVGLALGVSALFIRYNQWGQKQANLSGQEITFGDYASQNPTETVLIPLSGAAMGWGIGLLLDNKESDSEQVEVPRINVSAERDALVVIGGRDASGDMSQSQPVSTTTAPVAP